MPAPDHAASTSAASSLSKEDHACQVWLDGKRPNSVVFTIFGSLVKLTSEQLAELDWVLASSGYEFLRVIRSDQQAMGAPGATTIVLPLEFLAEMEGRGRVTSWCLQEAVLWHKALGAFLTHCRWNSMLESVCAGADAVLAVRGRPADQQQDAVHGVARQRGAQRGPRAGGGGGGDTAGDGWGKRGGAEEVGGGVEV